MIGISPLYIGINHRFYNVYNTYTLSRTAATAHAAICGTGAVCYAGVGDRAKINIYTMEKLVDCILAANPIDVTFVTNHLVKRSGSDRFRGWAMPHRPERAPLDWPRWRSAGPNAQRWQLCGGPAKLIRLVSPGPSSAAAAAAQQQQNQQHQQQQQQQQHQQHQHQHQHQHHHRHHEHHHHEHQHQQQAQQQTTATPSVTSSGSSSSGSSSTTVPPIRRPRPGAPQTPRRSFLVLSVNLIVLGVWRVLKRAGGARGAVKI
uniref:Uncharacterized protein n=1 Tax=Trichogramma kaykai TaxID=54128 RepID=A0ABD2XE27_9HYME